MGFKSIREWPENERPRERLLREGAAAMTEAQLLAIILRTGSGGKSALDLAMELLDTFGSLRNLGQASFGEISAISGIGTAKAAQLKASAELGRRMFTASASKGPAFTAGGDVHAFVFPKVQGLMKEVFYCLMLDVKNRLIRETRISEGTLSASLVHPREAFRDAIKESAASVIFVHTHPSGDHTPSREDILITEKLAAAGDTVGIRVLDHIIVADGGYTSMLEKGYLTAG
ncbi:MAG: JAB domain-containing protein [Nitrospirae bacterium]|nr:JAB domain-containing protein [Nitrospirota bacterium]